MSTDRENLAREMYAFYWAGDNWETTAQSRREVFLALADLALTYADRRVAEAVAEVERICGEWGCNPKFTLLLTSALSPAREGGE